MVQRIDRREPTYRMKRRLILTIQLILLRLTCFGALDPSLAERPHQWSAFPTRLSYGLVDLDGFDSTGYGYCKWGNWLDDKSGPNFVLHYDWLTYLPYDSSGNPDDLDLFLSTSDASLERALIPRTATWAYPMGRSEPGSISFTDASSSSLFLFRYLHFRNHLQNEAGRTPDERRIDAST